MGKYFMSASDSADLQMHLDSTAYARIENYPSP